jgi:hypothetical protein
VLPAIGPLPQTSQTLDMTVSPLEKGGNNNIAPFTRQGETETFFSLTVHHSSVTF